MREVRIGKISRRTVTCFRIETSDSSFATNQPQEADLQRLRPLLDESIAAGRQARFFLRSQLRTAAPLLPRPTARQGRLVPDVESQVKKIQVNEGPGKSPMQQLTLHFQAAFLPCIDTRTHFTPTAHAPRKTMTPSSTRKAGPHPAAPPPTATMGNWQLGPLIGVSQFSHIYQAHPVGQRCGEEPRYLLKCLPPNLSHDRLALSVLQNEAFVAAEVQHAHLSSVLASHVDRPPFFLIKPYLPGATVRAALQQIGGPLVTPHAFWIARQALDGLQALHQQGWRHGDVKPENLLVGPNGHTTLLDLGLAQRLHPDSGEGAPPALLGTPNYWSPEVLQEQASCTAASDIYSLGVTLFELLTGKLPFSSEDPVDLAAQHLSQRPPDPRRDNPQLTPRVGRLLARLLAKEPLRRPTYAELRDWLVDLEIETLQLRAAA